MSPRAFQTLLWSTVVAVGAAIWFVRADALPDASRAAVAESVAPFGSRVADVAKISVEAGDYTLALEKKGDTWVAGDRGNYPLRPSAVANLMSSLTAMKLTERKTSKPELYKEIGVEDRAAGAGSTALNFEYAGGGKAGGVLLGKRSNAASFDQAGATFVRRASDKQAWLAQGSANMPREFSEWFNEIPGVPATEVQRVVITEGGRVIFDAKKNDEGLYARADAPEPAANDTNVKRVAQALVGTGFDDVKPASAITTLKRSVRLELANGHIDVGVGDIDGKTYVRFEGTAASGPAVEVIKQAQGFAYRLPSYRLTGLTQSLADLTAKEESGALPPGAMPPGMPHGLPPELMQQLGGPR